ncbi:MAG: tetratricopeptide repeat protein [Candidatus Goldbacteria bacterium]|nr:tetratricopeptide repeat protein [Candidatus Goldiibacteriota bacterium]
MNIFFTEENFSFDEDFKNNQKLTYNDLIKYNSIQNALKTKKSICLTISLIYLMLGDILNLPLYGGLIPGHIYVRYKDETKCCINIETTLKGFEYYGYMSKAGLDVYGSYKNSYGKELNKYQVIGAYLNNLGNLLISIGELNKAEILLKKSIKYLPSISEPYINLGILYDELNKPNLSIKYYFDSLKINPENDFVFTKIGIIYFNQSRMIKAREYLEKAIKINKDNKEAIDFLNKTR